MGSQSIYVVIMAGGIGSRFWPQSTPARPKQFLDILQTGQTMIQQTVARVSDFCPVEQIYVVTSTQYVSLVQEQVAGLPAAQILGEPCMRNTAPCIAYAVWKIRQQDPDAVVLVLPSDSYIPDTDRFTENIRIGLARVSREACIMTLGIRPNAPETGYGYIEADKASAAEGDTVFAVKSFREKPRLELARQYLAQGGFYWNAGIFMASVSTFDAAFRRYLPAMAAQFDEGNVHYHTDSEQAFIDSMYPHCESISVDYGIMEKADMIVVQEATFTWSDVGAWNAVHDLQEKDSLGNTASTADRQVVLEGVSNCLVSVPEGTQAVIQGVNDLIIVQSATRLLICKKENEQEIKALVGKLK